MTQRTRRFVRPALVVGLASLAIPAIALGQPPGRPHVTISLRSMTEPHLLAALPAPLANLFDLAIPAAKPARTYWDGGEAARRRWEASRLAAIRPPVATLARAPRSATVSAGPRSGTADWYAIAACESSGRWDLNSGNGFWGGLQFTPKTWFAYGGGPYDGTGPFPYSPGEQIAVAERVLAAQGPSAWPNCFVWG